MDVSQWLLSEYQRLYKVRKSFGNVFKDARKAQDDHRRMTRHAEILMKRHINEEKMSPYLTPGRKKTPKKKMEKALNQTQSDLVKSKRYEQLLAWKQEKEKRKQEQKKKAKPIFKVTHLPLAIGLPDLENVNKQIKGKLIVMSQNEAYKFAPTNHKFKPPSNIKPVSVEQAKGVLKKTKPVGLNCDNSRRMTRSQKGTLPMLELPTRSRKVQDTNRVQLMKLEAEKFVPKTTAQTKIVSLHIESNSPNSDLKVYKKKPAKIKGDVNSTESTKYESTSRRNVAVQKGEPENVIKVVKSKNVEGKSTRIENKIPAKSERVTRNMKSHKPHQSEVGVRRTRHLDENKKLSPPVPSSEVMWSGDDFKTDTCDSPKQTEMNERQKLRRSKIKKIGNEVIDQEAPMKTLHASVKGEKSLRSRSNSTKSRHLKDVALNEDADVGPKQIKMNEERRHRRNWVLPNDSETIQVGKSKNESMENDIKHELIDEHKTPSKKPIQSKGSLRKSLHLNKKQEDVTSNEETEIRTSLKDIRIGVRQRRKSESLSVENIHSGKSDDDCGNVCVTPNKKVQGPVVYISPFVTISRGKSTARNEYFHRKSKGGECDSSPDVRRSTGPKAGAAYFQRILEHEINRIQGLCDEWTDYKDNQNPSEEASDMISVAIGQSQLLISKKFKQFQGLINTCENGNSEIPVTCEDLHGYWDVAYIQVENLGKRFQNLENLKRNNWEEILPQMNKTEAKKNLGPKKPKGKVTASLKDAIRAARMKAKSQATATEDQNQAENTSTFDGKFFTITSPQKSPSKKSSLRKSSPEKTPGRERRSLRATVLSSEANKRKSVLGWTIIRASHMALTATKNEDSKITPGRSILKNSQSVKKRASKSVLFRDNNRANVHLNETYPPAISNEKSSDIFPVLTNITNNDNASGKSKRRSNRNKLF